MLGRANRTIAGCCVVASRVEGEQCWGYVGKSLRKREGGTVWAFISLPGHTFDMGKNQAIEGQGGIQKKENSPLGFVFKRSKSSELAQMGAKKPVF